MLVFNTLYKTRPCILHRPSHHALYEPIKHQFFKSHEQHIGIIDNLTIVTWNNYCQKMIAEKSMDHLGLEYTVLGKGEVWHDNTDKIKLTNEFLPKVTTEFVLGVDGFDVILMDHPGKVIDLLEIYDCEMIFNANNGPWGDSKKLIEICTREFPRPYNHPNAGVWVGKTEYCRDFFEKVGQVTLAQVEDLMQNELHADFRGSEQVRVNLVFEELYPQVKIDWRCGAFQLINYSGAPGVKTTQPIMLL